MKPNAVRPAAPRPERIQPIIVSHLESSMRGLYEVAATAQMRETRNACQTFHSNNYHH